MALKMNSVSIAQPATANSNQNSCRNSLEMQASPSLFQKPSRPKKLNFSVNVPLLRLSQL